MDVNHTTMTTLVLKEEVLKEADCTPQLCTYSDMLYIYSSFTSVTYANAILIHCYRLLALQQFLLQLPSSRWLSPCHPSITQMLTVCLRYAHTLTQYILSF